MMMKRTGFVLLAMLLVASLGIVPLATAQEADQPEPPIALRARGDGLAALHGSGWTRVKGNGVLWVKGEEAITIEGVGHVKAFPDGWTEYVGFHGLARIHGRNVSLILAAERIDLLAIGSGRAILWGKGSYRIAELEPQEWHESFEIVPY